MKIDVTYEKADIIRLVKEDLERRKIQVKKGCVPEYKGALVVKLSIEADDDEKTAPSAPSAGVDLSPPPTTEENNDTEMPPDDGDMSDVLNQSRTVALTTKPTFKTTDNDAPIRRSLGPHESLEFPKG